MKTAKFRIEHCPLNCHEHSPDVPKWHYRVTIQGMYPVWGSFKQCLEWVLSKRTI